MSRAGSGRWRWLAWVAPVAAGVLVPLVGLQAAGHTLVTRDTARLHAPLRGLVVEALRELRLPLWNPHEATGLPLLAQMVHGVLHPVSLAAAALAPAAGMDLLIIAHALLGAIGAAVLARSLGTSAAAAVAAGLGYSLSGYALSMSSILHYQAAAATAPWAVAALRAAGASPAGVARAALAVAVLHLAGDPQWALLGALLGLALAAEARGRGGLGGAALGVALGTALAGVQLVTTWVYLQETVRGTFALTPWERGQWALAPWRLLELVAPGFFSGWPGASLVAMVFVTLGGSPVLIGPSVPSYTVPFVPSVFVGGALLALAGAGVGASRLGRLLGVATLASLWLALGRHLGAEQALHWVPVWGAFRYAEKVVGALTLCLALLAALGVDRLGSVRLGRPLAAVLAAAAGAGALAAWLGAGGGDDLLRRAGAGDVASQARQQLGAGLVHAAAGLAGLGALLAAAARWPLARRRVRAGAAALVAASSLAALPWALHLGTPGARQERPLRELAGAAPVVRVGTPLRGVPLAGHEHLDPSDRMLALESRMGVAPFAAPSGIDQIDTYTALLPRAFVLVDNTLGLDRDPGYWMARRRYGLTHVVVRQPRGPREDARARAAVAGGRRVLDDPAWGLSVWEVPHRPWASFAEQAIAVATEREAHAVLARVVRETSPAVVVEGAVASTGAPGRILGIERRPERIRIEADAPGDGLLVVNDAFWRGWVARIDGRPVAVLRADALVRAVPWPAGRHTLEMRYEPPEARLGALASAAGGLAVAGVLAWGRRRRGT